MKISFWDILTGILMFAGFGIVLVFANIFIDPYTILNPFPPPTLQPTLRVPTATPTQRLLPAIWTVTPTGTQATTTARPSGTAVPSRTSFVLPTRTSTNTPAPTATATGLITNTPVRTNTPLGGRTNTPTRTRTATSSSSSSFAVTSVQNVAASPSTWSTTCPYSISLSADISYTGDGIMTYYWVRSSDNAHFNGSLDVDGTSPDHLTTTITGGSSGYTFNGTYSLYVDHPNHQQFGGVTVVIACSTNDVSPVITSNGGGAIASISVAENTTTVTTVTATDADPSPTLTYSISGADAARFTIGSSTGVLAFSPAPNFEGATDSGGNNVYDLTVQVSDGLHTDTQTIDVTVTNANEAPVITSNGGGATGTDSVAENDTAVTTVTATDVDSGATQTYSISGGADSGDFAIDSGTGVLTFSPAPNFEIPTDADTNNIYLVTVQVTDGTLTDTQDLTVTVTNVNDNTPVITGGATASANVAENTTAVMDVDATDADAGTTIAYTISGGVDSAFFTINGSTGVLAFLVAPDYETIEDNGGDHIYDLTVQASDGTNTDTQDIAVTVTDENDNNPVITSNGGGATANISVAEPSTTVTTVTATDADAGATQTYSISGADSADFAIDSGTGVLTFSPAPDFEIPTDADTNNIYLVTVEVTDGTLTDTQDLTVTVTDIAD